MVKKTDHAGFSEIGDHFAERNDTQELLKSVFQIPSQDFIHAEGI